MNDTKETLAEFAARCAEMIKSREEQLGSYPGDGPTFDQLDKFQASLHAQLSMPSIATAWDLFKSAAEIDFSWLFPERDPLSEEMIPALKQIEKAMGDVLDANLPESSEQRQKYINLSIVANAADRTARLQGNKIMWRLVLARFIYWLGGGKR